MQQKAVSGSDEPIKSNEHPPKLLATKDLVESARALSFFFSPRNPSFQHIMAGKSPFVWTLDLRANYGDSMT